MPLKTPAFWQEKGWKAVSLLPLSFLYRIASFIHGFFVTPYSSSIPVICVGGAVAGGSGKTPTVHALLKLIQENGAFQKPVILTRGYGGRENGPVLVDTNRHTVNDVGDESLLHVRYAETIISADRAAGARFAEKIGADIILMDDGYQNRSLHQDLKILVINGDHGFGNNYLLPAGPLREPSDQAIEKADIVILTGELPIQGFDKPVVRTAMKIVSDHDMTKTYYGFAGLGNPGKFAETLKKNHFVLTGFTSFPDHHPYSDRDIEILRKNAGGAVLITTEKDFVRLPQNTQNDVDVLKISYTFNDPETILPLIEKLKKTP